MSSPVKVLKSGSVSASIFKNVTQEGKEYFSIQIQKSFFDKETQSWKYTNSFNLRDVSDLYWLTKRFMKNYVKEVQVTNQGQQPQNYQQPTGQPQNKPQQPSTPGQPVIYKQKRPPVKQENFNDVDQSFDDSISNNDIPF